MKIAIISAMEEEIAYTKEHFTTKKIDVLNSQDLVHYQGKYHEFYFLNSGIGKVNAAITTSLLIERYQPDLIISVGTAGGVNKELNIGDLVIGDKLLFHDVDVTAFGYEYGQYPQQEQYLAVNNLDHLIKVLKHVEVDYHIGTILTGDQFIADKKKTLALEEQFDNVYAIEMESSAILMTANNLGVDCQVIRTISDLAHGESDVEFDKYLEMVSRKFYKIVVAYDHE